jgi:hypothetical protein
MEKYEEDEYLNEDESNLEEDEYIKGEGDSVVEKPTIDGFFGYEEEIQNIERAMRGFSQRNGVWVYTNQPMARDGFISSMISSLRSIIKKGSYLGDLTEDEVNTILMEKNYEFAGSVYLEPTIEEDDAERIINMHDHMLELFMKTLREGLGNDTVRQMSASIYHNGKEQKKDTLINYEALGLKR